MSRIQFLLCTSPPRYSAAKMRILVFLLFLVSAFSAAISQPLMWSYGYAPAYAYAPAYDYAYPAASYVSSYTAPYSYWYYKR